MVELFGGRELVGILIEHFGDMYRHESQYRDPVSDQMGKELTREHKFMQCQRGMLVECTKDLIEPIV
jgi:hypothetical protein